MSKQKRGDTDGAARLTGIDKFLITYTHAFRLHNIVVSRLALITIRLQFIVVYIFLKCFYAYI